MSPVTGTYSPLISRVGVEVIPEVVRRVLLRPGVRLLPSPEGDLDFRGTLGVSKEAPVVFKAIRLHFELDTGATQEQVATLLKLTERYCVVFQTLSRPPEVAVTHRVSHS